MRAASRPILGSNEEALAIILQAIEEAGFQAGGEILLGLDVASSELYKADHYELESEGRRFTAVEFTRYLAELADKYPIVTIEDGMSEGDWAGLGRAYARARRAGAACRR